MPLHEYQALLTRGGGGGGGGGGGEGRNSQGKKKEKRKPGTQVSLPPDPPQGWAAFGATMFFRFSACF